MVLLHDGGQFRGGDVTVLSWISAIQLLAEHIESEGRIERGRAPHGPSRACRRGRPAPPIHFADAGEENRFPRWDPPENPW
jgi:hypothetical protein